VIGKEAPCIKKKETYVMKKKNDAHTQFTAEDKVLPFDGPEKIDRHCLECFPYEYSHTPSGQELEIITETDEFTSVCPFSGLPDFATITISYVPGEWCLELRSLKYYLLSYRNVGIWYEHLVNRMLEDLVECCKPRRMTVEIACNPRGGLASVVRTQYVARAPKKPASKSKK